MLIHNKDKNCLFYQVNYSISVKDSGQGISDEGIKKLFLDFSKLDDKQNNNLRGTGLGLSICKRIVEKMGGKINIKSQIGVGTSFIIEMKSICKLCSVNNRRTSEHLGRPLLKETSDLVSYNTCFITPVLPSRKHSYVHK